VNVNWKQVSAVGIVVAGIAVIHGLTSSKWRDIHTLGVVLGLVAAIAPKLD
jgi:hypothetical protein